jgi:hypothetical protein
MSSKDGLQTSKGTPYFLMGLLREILEGLVLEELY